MNINLIRQDLRKHYDLVITEIKRIRHGVINSNFLVQGPSGYFIFKAYTLNHKKEVEFELNILQYLAKKKFPCPRIVLTNSVKPLIIHQGKPAILLHYIPGRMAIEMSTDIIEKVGMLTGKFHRLLEEFPQKLYRITWEPGDIIRYIESEKESIIKKEFPDALHFIGFIKSEFQKLNLPSNLPIGITHQDIKPENIILDEKNNVHFIDFNNCYRGVLLYDAMTTIIWSCFEFDGTLDSDLLTSYMQGYQCERKLCKLEKAAFLEALSFRLLREAFVWPMRFSPSIAIEKTRYFLRAYSHLRKNENQCDFFQGTDKK